MIDLDEGYYLFVGGQILHGAIPFVDIWDRKPAGLFLLYAFFHLFGPYRLLAYQIGAVISVWLTSLLVMKMARHIAPALGALVAALLYIGCMNLAGGEGGQSPVFYNLLVAWAMSLIIDMINADNKSIKDMKRAACKVMVLFGLSLQIKYTVVFEGVFAGAFLLWLFYRKTGSLRDVALQALLWVVLAVLPTAIVALAYGLAGYGQEWWFANVISIFYRGQSQPGSARHQAIKMLVLALPFLLSILFRKMACPAMTVQQKDCGRFVNLWALSALLGVAVFGTRYIHYALPVFTPLSVAVAPLWNKKWGQVWLVVLLAYVTVKGQLTVIKHKHDHGNKALFDNVVSVLSHPAGCVFVYNASPVFYDFSDFCNMTTHPFPAHLYALGEQKATGINPLTEIQRILQKKPIYIVLKDAMIPGENIQARDILNNRLQTEYHLVYTAPVGKSSISVYGLNGAAPHSSLMPQLPQ
nr:glycosyltransferase family 39 protein [Acetobacter garciniae]